MSAISAAQSPQDKYAIYMEGTSSEMMEPGYWLEGSEDPDRILLTPMEISSIHGDSEREFDSIGRLGSLTRDQLTDEILFYVPAVGKLHDLYGNVIDKDAWTEAFFNRNMDSLEEENPIRHAVAVCNAELRLLPTADRGYSSSHFYDEITCSGIHTGERLLVLHTSSDGLWYFVKCRYTPGWIPADKIAFCSLSQWEEHSEGDFLLVTANRTRLPMESPDGDDFTEITMGTRFKLIPKDSVTPDRKGRLGRNIYAVKYPERLEDGSLGYREVFLPANGRDFNIGYLPYTRRNILNLAFSCLGDRYGWGGMFGARDCSSFIQDIYSCVGIPLPRNSKHQSEMDCRRAELDKLSDSEKAEFLKSNAAPGSLLYFPGHISMYLGETDGNIYCISSLGSGEDPSYEIQSVTINPMDTKRRNGKTWIESLTTCIMPEFKN